jgi:multiple sugar transport system ATP-binding protein
MSEVVLDNVTKRFGNVAAVDGMDLTIADGELLVLLGPTGAGKTTTLRTIAGLEKPETGRIVIGGQDMTNLQPASRNVAMVFQEYSLYPHYTVYENLAFPLRAPLRRLPEDEIRQKVTEVAKLLRIESKLPNKSTALSGGEMQRVAIGRALVRQPSVFLMDEPLSSLDAKLRDDLRVELKRIQMDLGATILYVTHDQIEAMTLADRIGVLSEGRLLQIGSPREIYRQPSSTYVACRLGSPRINLLPPGALAVEGGPSGADTMGIRPENIVLGNQGIPTSIQTVERLGNETVVHLEIEGQKLLALAPPGQSFQAGQQVSVNSLPGSALYFDQAGQRIT